MVAVDLIRSRVYNHLITIGHRQIATRVRSLTLVPTLQQELLLQRHSVLTLHHNRTGQSRILADDHVSQQVCGGHEAGHDDLALALELKAEHVYRAGYVVDHDIALLLRYAQVTLRHRAQTLLVARSAGAVGALAARAHDPELAAIRQRWVIAI